MYVVFCKIDHCIHIHWCTVMGLGHNDPWVESHMWPQETWGQRSSRGQWPLVQVFGKKVSVSTYFDIFSNLILQWLQKYVIAKAGETRGSRTALFFFFFLHMDCLGSSHPLHLFLYHTMFNTLKTNMNAFMLDVPMGATPTTLQFVFVAKEAHNGIKASLIKYWWYFFLLKISVAKQRLPVFVTNIVLRVLRE